MCVVCADERDLHWTTVLLISMNLRNRSFCQATGASH